MKKSLVALAALAATGAFAQSSVTISGNLSFGALTNTARDANATTTKTTIYGGIDTTNANRVNVIAVEDLGGGLKVTGRVDNRLTPLNAARATGDMFVQIDGGFGSIKVGQYTYASNAAWNAGAANTVSTVATSAQNLSTSIASYTTPAIAGLTASAALDLDTSGNSVGKDGWGLKFNYAAGPIGAQVSYTQAPKLASTATLSPIKVMSLAVSYDLGVAKVYFNQSDVRAGGLTIAQTAVDLHKHIAGSASGVQGGQAVIDATGHLQAATEVFHRDHVDAVGVGGVDAAVNGGLRRGGVRVAGSVGQSAERQVAGDGDGRLSESAGGSQGSQSN